MDIIISENGCNTLFVHICAAKMLFVMDLVGICIWMSILDG